MYQMLVLVAMSLASLAACDGFHYSTCENVASPILSINSLTISPTTVRFPGTLSITLEATVHSPITRTLMVDLTIKKKLWLVYTKVPCLFNLGSCSYNLCYQLSMLHESEDVQCPLKSDNNNSNCTCPFQPGTYALKGETFQIPNIPSVTGFAVSGTYTIKAKLRDTVTKQVVGCHYIEVSVKA